MNIEGGNLTFTDDHINVFTLFSQVNKQLPFFTGLYEGTRNGEETATFVIGNNARLSKVIVPLNGNAPSHRQRRVCRSKITNVIVTSHLVVACDDQTIHVELLDSWYDFNISYTRLLEVLRSGLSKSYISDSGEVGMIVVLNQTSNTSYWLAYKESPDLENCTMNISATFTDGLLLFEGGNSSVLFFAILDGDLTVVDGSCDAPHTIATDVCYQGDCYFHHTEHLLYIGDQNRTTIVNPRTNKVITTQFADIHDVLPVAERALQQCKNELQVPITPTKVVSTPTTVSSLKTNLAITPSIITIISTKIYTTPVPPTSAVQTTANTNVLPTQSSEDTTESQTNKGYIVAGIGVILILALILTAIVLCYLKRKRRHIQLETKTKVVKKEDNLQIHDLSHSPQVPRQATDKTQDRSERESFLVASSHA